MISQNQSIEFNHAKLRYRLDHLQGRNELIAKAIGWKKDCAFHVFDTTAGLGKDALLLAALGCKVVLFERHVTISHLLQEALENARHSPNLEQIISRMTLVKSCAIHYLSQINTKLPDIIYCDPMFETKKKSALVKKEMQFLQSVVGSDKDAVNLVDIALTCAKKRVVVKRAYYAPPFIRKPDIVFSGRSHRFDVYLTEGKKPDHPFVAQ